MTTREEFEAWAEPEGMLLGRLVNDWRYESMATEWAYRAWQAAKGQYLEEAAKECDLMQKHFDIQDAIDAAEQCAMGIRALKD